MGVPAFYRWLTEKYPKVVQDVLEERVPADTDEIDWSTAPNPSGLECDNLYIDMNGIIHPCSHPEIGKHPDSEEEMYNNVCLYVDRLLRVMRPRQLVYLAIDGVAPRAKMNQQRSRRFRAAQEARELKEIEQTVRQELEVTVDETTDDPHKSGHGPWDSNVITPGTPFMVKLAVYLRFYIRKRLSTDKNWKHLRVLFSDASIPGEGEHKIMSHIRLQRAQPGYLPNTVHVLHGLDADLIMLGLATHEAHFYISREEVLFGRKSQEDQDTRQKENGFADAQRALNEIVGPVAMQRDVNRQKPFQRLSIPILREYLAFEFASCLQSLPFTPSLERLIDDIVFLCFFVGNDFLPHLPSLDIRDGALDFLFNAYARTLPALGDYITASGGNVNLAKANVIMAEVGAIEDHVFRMKYDNEQREQNRRKQYQNNNKKNNNPQHNNNKPPVPQQQQQPQQPPPIRLGRAARVLAAKEDVATPVNSRSAAKKVGGGGGTMIQVTHRAKAENDAAAAALRKSLSGTKPLSGSKRKKGEEQSPPPEATGNTKEDNDDDGDAVMTNVKETRKKKAPKSSKPSKADPTVVGEIEEEFDADDSDSDDDDDDDALDKDIDAPKLEDIIKVRDPEVAQRFKEKVKGVQQKKLDEYAQNVEDKVRLHESGWKDRYYSDKCKADDVANHGGREHLFRSYVMGLCWIMKYYYDGCPSWKWYYPFHYAPFASDLQNIDRFSADCRSFELSTPFNPVEQLMAVLPSDSVHAVPQAARWLMTDPESPILDFYPVDVPVDPNGKAMPWLWVVLLPFIDEERLLAAFSPTMAKWTQQELLCNTRGLDDGYLYIHCSNQLSKKFASVLRAGCSAKDTKTKLTDAAAYGCPGFSGRIRPPLANELRLVDDTSIVKLPESADRVDAPNNVFDHHIEVNQSVCVAFSEPPKLSHKSILLPGAEVPPAALKPQDKVVRRPRLNRGGGTIANLGCSNGQSHQSGYGSMNISPQERNLAQQMGRGNDMYQTGNRTWGSMEPMPKRRNGPQNGGPFQLQQQGLGAPGYNAAQGYPGYNTQQGFNNAQSFQNQGYNNQGYNAQGYNNPQGYNTNKGYNNQGYSNQMHNQRPANSYGNGPRQPAGYNQAPNYSAKAPNYSATASYQQSGPAPPLPPPRHPATAQAHHPGHPRGGHSNRPVGPYPPAQQQQQQQPTVYDFRSHNQIPRPGTSPGFNARGGHDQSQNGQDRRSRASADVMNSLRAQLTSTLRNKNSQQNNGSRR